MWYIQLLNESKINSEYEFLGHQFIEIYIYDISNSIEVNYNEDYKKLNIYLEEHIIHYVNNMSSSKIETIVYNYGIDNAIILLNNFVIDNKKHINTTSKSLLFSIFISRFKLVFVVEYTTKKYNNYYLISYIKKIQRFWRNILINRKKLTNLKVIKEFDYVLDKINKQIEETFVKDILIYIIKKYRRQISTTLKI